MKKAVVSCLNTSWNALTRKYTFLVLHNSWKKLQDSLTVFQWKRKGEGGEKYEDLPKLETIKQKTHQVGMEAE